MTEHHSEYQESDSIRIERGFHMVTAFVILLFVGFIGWLRFGS